MRYVLECLAYDGWHADTDEDGRVILLDLKTARQALRNARGNSSAYWGRNTRREYRIRIVNARAQPNHKARQEAKRRWVTDYTTDRSYGGPEEGGWWFDTGEPVKGTSQSFYNTDRAEAERDRRDALAEAFNKSRGSRGEIGSVICDYALRAFIERHPPRAYPDQRPYYC